MLNYQRVTIIVLTTLSMVKHLGEQLLSKAILDGW